MIECNSAKQFVKLILSDNIDVLFLVWYIPHSFSVSAVCMTDFV